MRFIPNLHWLSLLSSVAFLSSCQHPPQSSRKLAHAQTTNSWSALEEELKTLPADIQECWPSHFLEDLHHATEGKHGKKLAKELRSQLLQYPGRFPVLADYPLWLQHQSLYDGYVSHYLVIAPRSGNPYRSLFVFLGTESDYPNSLRDLDIWRLFIPSRPGLNHKLIAEGDFWDILKDFSSLYYPQTLEAPFYLVGEGVSADTALVFATRPQRVPSALLIGDPTSPWSLSLLTNTKIFAFPTQAGSASPWGSEQLILSLKESGNTQARYFPQGLVSASKQLVQQAEVAVPWLKIVCKQRDNAPYLLSHQIVGRELVLDAENVQAVQLTRSLEYPETLDISSVRLNQKLFSLPQTLGSITIGEMPQENCSKGQMPSGWGNFFSGDPVYIVYQDDHEAPNYLATVEQLANQLATFHTAKAQNHDVQLPVMPLSTYRTQQLPPHRLIAIGQAVEFLPFIFSSPDYLAPQLIHKLETQAGYLIYPPENSCAITLALLLTAPNRKGMEMLQNRYVEDTLFTDSAELRLWKLQKEGYVLTEDKVFS